MKDSTAELKVLFFTCTNSLLYIAGADYNAPSLPVSLSADNVESCVQIPIVDDVVIDPDEEFLVLLQTVSTIAIIRAGRESATVTITDNDQGKYYRLIHPSKAAILQKITATVDLPTFYPILECFRTSEKH